MLLLLVLLNIVAKSFVNRLSIVVKRPPSYMPLTEAKELSRKIDAGVPIDTHDGPGYDNSDETCIDEEFIDIVMPLINMSPDKSKSTFSYNILLKVVSTLALVF